jgi:hypothetical protein
MMSASAPPSRLAPVDPEICRALPLKQWALTMVSSALHEARSGSLTTLKLVPGPPSHQIQVRDWLVANGWEADQTGAPPSRTD